MEKEEQLGYSHRAVRAEEARLFAPSRSIDPIFKTGLPAFLATHCQLTRVYWVSLILN